MRTLDDGDEHQNGASFVEERHAGRIWCCDSLFSKLRSFYIPLVGDGAYGRETSSPLARAPGLIQRNHANCHSSRAAAFRHIHINGSLAHLKAMRSLARSLARVI
jgi:hypothetical protein